MRPRSLAHWCIAVLAYLVIVTALLYFVSAPPATPASGAAHHLGKALLTTVVAGLSAAFAYRFLRHR